MLQYTQNLFEHDRIRKQASLMEVIVETRRAHLIRCLPIYSYI